MRRAQRDDLGAPLQYGVRFIRNAGGQPVIDRSYNLIQLLAAYGTRIQVTPPPRPPHTLLHTIGTLDGSTAVICCANFPFACLIVSGKCSPTLNSVACVQLCEDALQNLEGGRAYYRIQGIEVYLVSGVHCVERLAEGL